MQNSHIILGWIFYMKNCLGWVFVTAGHRALLIFRGSRYFDFITVTTEDIVVHKYLVFMAAVHFGPEKPQISFWDWFLIHFCHCVFRNILLWPFFLAVLLCSDTAPCGGAVHCLRSGIKNPLDTKKGQDEGMLRWNPLKTCSWPFKSQKEIKENINNGKKNTHTYLYSKGKKAGWAGQEAWAFSEYMKGHFEYTHLFSCARVLKVISS